MKNLSMGKKLTAGFGSMVLLLLISVSLAIGGTGRITKEISVYSEHTVPNADHIRNMQVNLQYVIRCVREALDSTNAAGAKAAFEYRDTFSQAGLVAFESYAANQVNNERET